METEVRVYYANPEAKAPKFHLLIDGKEYPVDQEGDARLLTASWLAQDKNGKYAVDLISVFPSGEQQVLRLGEYTVDGVAPELFVTLLGTTIDGEPLFQQGPRHPAPAEGARGN